MSLSRLRSALAAYDDLAAHRTRADPLQVFADIINAARAVSDAANPALDPRVDWSNDLRPAVLGGECSWCFHRDPLHEPSCRALACVKPSPCACRACFVRMPQDAPVAAPLVGVEPKREEPVQRPSGGAGEAFDELALAAAVAATNGAFGTNFSVRAARLVLANDPEYDTSWDKALRAFVAGATWQKEWGESSAHEPQPSSVAGTYLTGGINLEPLCLCPATSEYDPPCPRHGVVGIGRTPR